MPQHVNGQNRLFGGQLVAWIDVVAAVEARRHTKRQVTTVAIDHLEFLSPVNVDEVVRLDARVTWTGRTSLEVEVESYVEYLDGGQRLVNRAYLVFVALDADGRPCGFESYTPATDEENRLWADALRRKQHRMETRSPRR